MPPKNPPTLAKLFRRAADTDRAFATAVEASQVGKSSDHVARTLDQAMGEEMDKIAAGAELLRQEPRHGTCLAQSKAECLSLGCNAKGKCQNFG